MIESGKTPVLAQEEFARLAREGAQKSGVALLSAFYDDHLDQLRKEELI